VFDCLRNKIVQGATAVALNAVYESDFCGWDCQRSEANLNARLRERMRCSSLIARPVYARRSRELQRCDAAAERPGERPVTKSHQRHHARTGRNAVEPP
jgi:hypothetical protein